jgi:XTP/dITP diphosphohydrolase
VLAKVKEELEELSTEIDSGDLNQMEAEFGDVMFSLVNYARFLKINPETALERTNKKFIKRFNYIEENAEKSQRKVSELSIEEMEVLWQEAKKTE